MPVAIRLENSDKTVLIDVIDFEVVSKYTWWYSNKDKCALARRKKDNGKVTTIHLHRLIMGITDTKLQVTHKNDNKLDCQRANLEVMRAGLYARRKGAMGKFTNNPISRPINITKVY